MAEWVHIGDDTSHFTKCPHGEVHHNYEWEKRTEEDDDSGEDVFAVRQICSMTPGKAEGSPCSSTNWHNEWQVANNQWDTSEFENVSVYDSDPDGGGGTVSVNVGYAAASINWGFQTDGQINKYLDGNRVRWKVDDIWAGERTVTQELEPGSVAIIDDTHCGETRKLTRIRTEGHFEEIGTRDNYGLYISWDLNLENYCQD